MRPEFVFDFHRRKFIFQRFYDREGGKREKIIKELTYFLFIKIGRRCDMEENV
jgi:hypothetical protein